MKLLIICAIALCMFAQVARAQEEDVEAAAAPAVKEEHKQEEEEASLESRGAGYNLGGARGLNGLNRGGIRGSAGRGNRGALLLSGGGLRGAGGLVRGAGLGGGNRLGSNNGAIIQNIGITNKQVPGYTQILPTVETNSRERHDVKSQSDSYFRQNSASTVTQNNRQKQTFVHRHLNQVYYHPRHITHVHKHHHTTFIKRLFPEVTKIQINQKQKIVEPEKLTIVKYTQDESFKNLVAPTKRHYASKYERLHTINEPVRNLGVRNIGNPLAAARAINNFNGFASSSRYVGGGRGLGGSYGGNNLYKRAGDAQEVVEAKPETVAAPEVKQEEEEVAEKKE